MADIRCPMCGKSNQADLDVCQFCGARLKPLLPPSPDNSRSIKPGEQPIPKGTAEFEKVKPSGQGPIHPGEAPTKKDTADLEKALPSWLRSLRGAQDEAAAGFEEATPSDESNAVPPTVPSSETPGGTPDWLAGLDKASAADEEAAPDWLAGLREEKTDETGAGQGFETEPASDLGNADWMARLDGNPPPTPSEPLAFEPSSSEPVAGSNPDDETPAWLKSLHAFDSLTSETSEPVAPPAREEKFPDWFSGLPGISTEAGELAEPDSRKNEPDWVDQLRQEKDSTGESPFQGTGTEVPSSASDLPDWLDQLKDKNIEPEVTAQTGQAADSGSRDALPDWLSQLQEKSVESEPGSNIENEPAPAWLSSLEPQTGAPIPPSGENMPDWLSNLEPKPGSENGAASALTGNVPPEKNLPSELSPSWLSQFQAEMNAAEASSSEPPAKGNEAEPLPEWLAGIEPGSTPASTPPAFVADEKGGLAAETTEKAFSMETPDWLTKVTPEQGAEKSPLTPISEEEQEQQPADKLQAAELPSWVQAMRPVESVVDQTKTASLEENQVTERSGPLAGLVGVLPGGPGLGMSRKPPAYSVKLQVSTAQQRYISNLEQLVSRETQASKVKGERFASNRLLRWLISGILVLVIFLPLIFPKARLTPPTTLEPSDRNATINLIGAIPANAPVLVAFDYGPALSGELEAAAAPLIDQLQSKGARLTIVSTSPTGPVLAERFLRTTLLVNSHQYKFGEQYINLGYIAGGPTGISLFASQPSTAMPLTMNGLSAWGTAPLKGVSKLSDFAAVMILTDDADTGRNWIEQAGLYLGKAPMIMVISAQAEPMVRPYFDSGQLKGIVSGLPDAKKYEQQYSRPGLAGHYWDSFSLGTLVAEMIIAIGAIWSALLVWRSHLQKSGKKG